MEWRPPHHGVDARVIHLHLQPIPPDARPSADDRAVLDATEHARAARLRRPQDQALYVHAHALLRRVLSQHHPVPAPAWRFTSGPHGKPALCPQHHPHAQGLRFNLSHCAGWVAVAVAWGRDVGVDVETRASLHDVDALAPLVLSPAEARHADNAPTSSLLTRQRFFLTRWTLKEATLKALGLGLGGIELPALDLAPAPPGHPSPWHTRVLTPQAPALQTRLESLWLHTQPEGDVHQWALACERHTPDERLTWQLIRHPAPSTF